MHKGQYSNVVKSGKIACKCSRATTTLGFEVAAAGGGNDVSDDVTTTSRSFRSKLRGARLCATWSLATIGDQLGYILVVAAAIVLRDRKLARGNDS
jgi:hypothetical protein